MAAERLQKILAQAGIASRRAAERLILDGKVRVNGRVVTELGAKAVAHKDRIEVNGERIVAETQVYYLLHKPRETVTTLSDPEGRETIKDLIRGVPERVFPVGRLDFHTSGALLLTNDGDLAEALLRPKQGVPKVYAVKVQGRLDVPELDRLRNGVKLDDGYTTRKADVFVLREEGTNTWLQITLKEGKNRQIHRMMEGIGRRVSRLARLSFAGLTTDGLRPGEWRPLLKREVDKLLRDYAMGGVGPKQGEVGVRERAPRKRTAMPRKFAAPKFDDSDEAPKGPGGKRRSVATVTGKRESPRFGANHQKPRVKLVRDAAPSDYVKTPSYARNREDAPVRGKTRGAAPARGPARGAAPARSPAPRGERREGPRSERRDGPRSDRREAPKAGRRPVREERREAPKGSRRPGPRPKDARSKGGGRRPR